MWSLPERVFLRVMTFCRSSRRSCIGIECGRARHYQGYEQPETRDERIAAGWFEEGWLPFASFAEGTLCLIADYSRAAADPGQIIAFTHDPDSIDYVCRDFPTLLMASLQQLSADPEEYMLC